MNDSGTPCYAPLGAIEIRRAEPVDHPIIAILAHRIWHTSFRDLITREQIDYMLARRYTPEAMAREILAHRYELQYVLYLLALHRLLKLRLPDYDYDRHVGGALYLFLRGSHGASGGVHAERPPRALIEALDHLFARATARETA